MRAAWFESFGTAAEVLQVGEQPTPAPGPGEVLVRLHTSGVNPSDVKKRAGSAPDLLDQGFVIPNSDGAGVVEAVGEGVDGGRIGERVWVYQAQFERRFGTAAEYVALDARRAVALPDGTSFEIGACLGIPAMTAHRCVFADGPVDGQSILVMGGAGRVAHYAVQFASQAGARVVATASNDADVAACEAAGAAAVVNHRRPDWPSDAVEANGGARFDRIIELEFGANLDGTLSVVRTSGTIVAYASAREPEPALPFYRMMYLDLLLRFVIVYAMPEQAKRDAVGYITAALQDQRLLHRVAHVLPLDDIVRANELVEQDGMRGCVLVSMA